MSKKSSKAKFKRIVQHRLRQILKTAQDVTMMRRGIVHSNWGSGPDRDAFRDKYSKYDE